MRFLSWSVNQKVYLFSSRKCIWNLIAKRLLKWHLQVDFEMHQLGGMGQLILSSLFLSYEAMFDTISVLQDFSQLIPFFILNWKSQEQEKKVGNFAIFYQNNFLWKNNLSFRLCMKDLPLRTLNKETFLVPGATYERLSQLLELQDIYFGCKNKWINWYKARKNYFLQISSHSNSEKILIS